MGRPIDRSCIPHSKKLIFPLRIIAGKYRGRVIRPPKGLPVRPTTDLAKESLFNILNNRVDFDEMRILDCFAGTGSMSYEFLSRGAGSLLAIDADAKCVQYISSIFKDLDATQARAERAQVERYLQDLLSLTT